MKTFYDIKSEISWLEGVLSSCRKYLEHSGNERIRAVKRLDDTIQYYIISENGDTNGKYAPIRKWNLVKSIAQKEYFRKVQKIATERLELMKKFGKRIELLNVADAYYEINSLKKNLIDDVFGLSNEEFAKNWESVPYKTNPFPVDGKDFVNVKGEVFRSKSELIIANLFNEYHIPYKYEKACEIDGRTYYPDFTVLNKRTQEEYILEHFGMMDNEEYRKRCYEKIELYQEEFPGHFLFTFEEYRHPLRISFVRMLIEKYLV